MSCITEEGHLAGLSLVSSSVKWEKALEMNGLGRMDWDVEQLKRKFYFKYLRRYKVLAGSQDSLIPFLSFSFVCHHEVVPWALSSKEGVEKVLSDPRPNPIIRPASEGSVTPGWCLYDLSTVTPGYWTLTVSFSKVDVLLNLQLNLQNPSSGGKITQWILCPMS